MDKLSSGLAVLALTAGLVLAETASGAPDASVWSPETAVEARPALAVQTGVPAAALSFTARAGRAGVVFRLPVGVAGRVTVMDVWGRVVWSRQADDSTAELAWDGRGTRGTIARGVYVARFQPLDSRNASGTALERKFTLNP